MPDTLAEHEATLKIPPEVWQEFLDNLEAEGVEYTNEITEQLAAVEVAAVPGK